MENEEKLVCPNERYVYDATGPRNTSEYCRSLFYHFHCSHRSSSLFSQLLVSLVIFVGALQVFSTGAGHFLGWTGPSKRGSSYKPGEMPS